MEENNLVNLVKSYLSNDAEITRLTNEKNTLMADVAKKKWV